MPDDKPQSLLGHLEELRRRIVWSAIAVAVAAGFSLIFADRIKNLLEDPYLRACHQLAQRIQSSGCSLQVLNPTEQFSVLMKIALFGGLVLASPVVLYQIWAFVNPALTSRERRWVVPIVASCVGLFLSGVAFGYWIMPRGLRFLLGIFPDIRTNLRLNDYFSFATRFMLAFGASFLYPVFLFAAAAAGVIRSEQLARGRRWAVLIIVTVAAIITPTGDALTLTLLSVPLYTFYEATYWLIRLVLHR